MHIALIGNCQVHTFAALADIMLDDPRVRKLDYSDPSSRSEDTRRRFADGLAECDVILAQTTHLSFTGEQDLRRRYGGKLITIANFYFRGLFPDSCYIGDFQHRVVTPMPVHSILVLDAFRRGLSEEAALRQFDIEAMARLGLLNAWAESMEEMRRREANGIVDVPAADMMEDACRRYPAFLTMNHPNAVLLAEYLSAVFRFAGINQRPANPLTIRDPLAEHDTTPIMDEVAEHLRLPYRVSQRWKINGMGRRFVSREDYVAECYEAYRNIGAERLVVNSPTDLVAALGADPARAYLVDHTAPCPIAELPPSETADPNAQPGVASALTPQVVRREVERAIRSMELNADDIQRYIHIVHSHVEVVDPKVEHLVHVMSLLMRSVEQIRQSQINEASYRASRLPRRIVRRVVHMVRQLRSGSPRA